MRDVDLAGGAIRVRASKTEAGVRTVDLRPELRDELLTWRMNTEHDAPTALVFGTGAGNREMESNVRRRMLAPALALANEDAGDDPLPAVTPHGLRRSFASLLIAEGDDLAYVMDQLGHRNPKMTLGLYAKALKGQRRRERAPTGTGTPEMPTTALDQTAA